MSQATETQAIPAAAAATPDLLYTEDETSLRAAVRSLLDDRAAWRDVLARIETEQTCDTALWQTLAQQVGCAGLLVPEEQGGAGASYREAAVVAEELGRTVAPVPFLGSAVVATTALLAVGDAGLLAEVASGATTRRADRAVRDDRHRRPADPVIRVTGGAAKGGDGAGGDLAGCPARCAGSPTRWPPTCCWSRPTACPTGCTPSAPTTPA